MKNKSTPLSQSHKLYASNANHLAFQNDPLHQKNRKDTNTFNHHLYSKSYVFDKQANKKEEIGLRKTINYDKQAFQTNSKKKLNTFFRNSVNSVQSDKEKSNNLPSKIDKSLINSGYDEIGYVALKSTASSIKQQLNKQQNYLKIMEKLSKKQKLINELKQLSKFNITDLIRKPQVQCKKPKMDISIGEQILKKAKKEVEPMNETMNKTYYTPRDIFETKKYDYSPAYKQQKYNPTKQNTQGQRSINDIYQNIKQDVIKASSYLNQKQTKMQLMSPTKNLYKSKFQKSPSNSNNQQYKPSYNSNVYYTPKQIKNQQNLKMSLKKIDLSNSTFHNNKDEAYKNYHQVNYKTSRYKQTFSQPNTPLLTKPTNKTARNMVDIKKNYQFRQFKDESYNHKNFTYIDTIYSEPNTPLLKPKEEKKTYKNIQDIRIYSQKRIKENSNYFILGKPKIYDFELTKELGQGKFGTVYQAIHKQTRSIYALKKLSKKNIKQNLMIDQLIKEIKIQSFCNHENILRLYGFFDDLQYVYIILQYMEQGTLFQNFKKQKTFTEKQTAKKINQIAQGIKYLHQNGITHRDIKPQNIVLSHGIGKLCDFGWATVCNGRRKTYCGTFDYVAPQILQGEQYDETVDLWCLGVLAYELLVGKAPFYHLSRKQTMKRILNVQNETIQYPSHLSKQTISFIENLIRKNPEERMSGKQIMNHPFILNANSE